MQERLPQAHLVTVEDSPSQQSLNDVASFLGPWIDIFMDGKSTCTNVVGDAAQASTIVAFVLIVDSTNFRCCIDNRHQNVDVEIRRHVLKNTCRTFHAHSGIDVLARQWTQVIGWISNAIELGEHQVPNFDGFA